MLSLAGRAQGLPAPTNVPAAEASAGDQPLAGPVRMRYIQKFTERYRREFSAFGAAQRRLMNYIEEELLRHDLPPELKYLVYLESSLQLEALSTAGARGPWQLMPGTAGDLGLRVDDQVDERTDVARSTRAAIRYLKQLYYRYGDWMLVVAAYNAGPGRVNAALSRAGGARDIRRVEAYLPEGTRNYVRRFEAAIRVASKRRIPPYLPDDAYSRSGFAASSASSASSVSPASSAAPASSAPAPTAEQRLNAGGLASVAVDAGYRLDMIAAALDIAEKKLRALNRDFDEEMAELGSTRLVLPKDKMTDFKLHAGEILDRCLQVRDGNVN